MIGLRLIFLGLLSTFCATSFAQQATWPISGSTTPDTIAAQFGPRILNSAYDYHRGLDFRKPKGTPIYAPLSGTVVRVRPYIATGADSTTTLRRFGNFIVIAHEDVLIDNVATKNQTVYQHLETIDVTLGQHINQGQLIGTVGNTGDNIYTDHLHFEWYHNKNNGDINRENVRNPMELFTLPTRKAAVILERKQDSLQVYVHSANGYFGLNELVVRIGADTLRHVHFEKKISINPLNEDENPYQGLRIWPDSFTHGSIPYGIKFTFEAQYNANSDIVVKAVGVQNYAVEHLFEHSKNHTMLSGTAGWRLLSVPSQSYTVADFAALTPVQGISGSNWPNAQPNFYFYNTSGNFIAPASINDPIVNGSAFISYLFNNDIHSSSRLPILLHANVNEPTNDVSVPLYSGAAGRFTLVGNPFSTTINASAITGVGGFIQNTVHLWDNTSQSYKSRDRQANGGLLIAPWQGFWVETSDETITSLNIPTSAKTNEAGENYLYKESPPHQVVFEIRQNQLSRGTASVVFRDEATLSHDIYDAGLPPSLGEQEFGLSFLAQANSPYDEKSVESLPLDLENPLILPLKLSWLPGENEALLAWSGDLPQHYTATLIGPSLSQPIRLNDRGRLNLNELVVENSHDATSNRNIVQLMVNISPKNTTHSPDLNVFIPEVAALEQNFPNPFNPVTSIQYSLPESSEVTLAVYTMMGQLVDVLVNGLQSSGWHTISFNAEHLSSGVYMYRLTAGDMIITRKMTLMK
jgi:murein DD-endopeptidase MepM/ murein hydrolase activator NlpD